jgi:hypothetical protein
MQCMCRALLYLAVALMYVFLALAAAGCVCGALRSGSQPPQPHERLATLCWQQGQVHLRVPTTDRAGAACSLVLASAELRLSWCVSWQLPCVACRFCAPAVLAPTCFVAEALCLMRVLARGFWAAQHVWTGRVSLRSLFYALDWPAASSSLWATKGVDSLASRLCSADPALLCGSSRAEVLLRPHTKSLTSSQGSQICPNHVHIYTSGVVWAGGPWLDWHCHQLLLCTADQS